MFTRNGTRTDTEGIENKVSKRVDRFSEKEGLLTKEIVAKKLNISEQEFEAYL